MEYYLNFLKDPEKKLILSLQELILLESANFYKKYNLHWLSAPVTTGAISSPMGLGSDSKPVEIILDGQKTFLADSMQFLLEYGCRFFNTGCWYIMPTFRGENIDHRHLKQFFHSEAEIPGNLNDIMELAEKYIKFLIEKIQNLIGQKETLATFLENDVPRITFDEAEKILGKNNIRYHNGWREITDSGEQRLLQYFNGPAWITNFDEQAVPFYQKASNGKAENADLLMGIGETLGCGERWEKAEEVLESLKRHRVDPAKYSWYLRMREEFPMQTAGFGMGIERFLLFVLGKDDIRNMQIFRRFNDGKDIV